MSRKYVRGFAGEGQLRNGGGEYGNGFGELFGEGGGPFMGGFAGGPSCAGRSVAVSMRAVELAGKASYCAGEAGFHDGEPSGVRGVGDVVVIFLGEHIKILDVSFDARTLYRKHHVCTFQFNTFDHQYTQYIPNMASRWADTPEDALADAARKASK